MEFQLICAACFIVGLASQLILLLKAKKLLPRLCPSILILAAGIYSALRMFGIISYPEDGRSFFDTGVLTGIVLMIFVAALAAGCIAGAFAYLVIRVVKGKKARIGSNA